MSERDFPKRVPLDVYIPDGHEEQCVCPECEDKLFMAWLEETEEKLLDKESRIDCTTASPYDLGKLDGELRMIREVRLRYGKD